MSKKILTEDEKLQKEFLNKLRSVLRRAWSKWHSRYSVLNAAKRPYKGPNKRQKVEYKCNVCGNYFKSGEVSVDHITPVSSLTIDNVGEWVLNLFCDEDGLQVLCKKDHDRKTAGEASERRRNKV